MTETIPDRRILQARTNLKENQNMITQAQSDKRVGLDQERAENRRLRQEEQARKKAEREKKAAAKQKAKAAATRR